MSTESSLACKPAGAHTSSYRVCLSDFIRECQVLAGEEILREPEKLLERTRELVNQVPASIPLPERAIIAIVITKQANRILRMVGLAEDESLLRSAQRMAEAVFSASWHHEAAKFLVQCACYLELRQTVNRIAGAPFSASVHATCLLLEKEYMNPALTLKIAARAAGCSASHLAHRLKSETGSGFRRHLRLRRIAAALRLLGNRHLIIKEIATSVGYVTRRQFERDFRRVLGCCATAVRATPLLGDARASAELRVARQRTRAISRYELRLPGKVQRPSVDPTGKAGGGSGGS